MCMCTANWQSKMLHGKLPEVSAISHQRSLKALHDANNVVTEHCDGCLLCCTESLLSTPCQLLLLSRQGAAS